MGFQSSDMIVFLAEVYTTERHLKNLHTADFLSNKNTKGTLFWFGGGYNLVARPKCNKMWSLLGFTVCYTLTSQQGTLGIRYCTFYFFLGFFTFYTSIPKALWSLAINYFHLLGSTDTCLLCTLQLPFKESWISHPVNLVQTDLTAVA